jgi:ERCC4-type nuclease
MKGEATHAETYSEEMQQFLAELVARVCKCMNLRLVASYGGRQRLLGFSIDEFAKVEGSLRR